MQETIDCLFIGHNEMDFVEYEKSVRKMGTNSGAYRDLNLNFIRYNNKSYHVSEVFNLFCRDSDVTHPPLKPISIGEAFSATIAYLGTYLNRRGFTFDYVNSFHDEKEVLANKLARDNIRTIAITTTYYVFALPIHEIISFIKEYNHQAKIIIGGPFIASQVRTQEPGIYEYLFETIGADFYVNSSQGEATLVKILNALRNNLPVDQINNIYYKTANGYVTTPLLREDNKLSENMVDWRLFARRAGEYVNVRTSISCPFSCAFCGFPQHAGTYQTASIDAIEKELNQLDQIESLKGVSFIDDTLNVPVKRFKEILNKMIANKYKFRWISNLRCQFVDRETVELMKESGCDGVFLGIESGSEKILKNMNKAACIEKYHKGIALLKEMGIVTFGSFIVGFPGETPETVQETLQFIEESKIDFYRTHLWYCDPITPIWKEKEKYNIKGQSFEWSHTTMDSNTASDLIEEMFQSVETSVWIPQYNFDFDNLWHLMHRGLTLNWIKEFLKNFNRGIKNKLQCPYQPEVPPEVINNIKNSCRENNDIDNSIDEELQVTENYGVDFNF